MEFAQHEIEWTPEKVARLWNFYASDVAFRQHYFGAQAGRAVAAFIDRHVRLRSLGNILDFSCGLGDVIEACLPYTGAEQRLFGIDMSRSSIEAVNERFRGIASVAEARCISSFPSDFPGESFSLVVATEVIEHLDDTELDVMVNECGRLLASGGYVVLTTPNEENYDAGKVCCPECGCVFHRWQHRRTWSAGSLRAYLEQRGFETVVSTPIAWGTIELPETPAWRSLLRRVLAPFRTPPAETGLVYIGRKWTG